MNDKKHIHTDCNRNIYRKILKTRVQVLFFYPVEQKKDELVNPTAIHQYFQIEKGKPNESRTV